MIAIRKSEERGHADHGWLNAYHTFSFAGFYDPRHMGFGALRVINQDVIAPGSGFDTHAHDNMEIVTYVLDGVLEHRDSMGNGSRIRPGEVQVMSAGTGITHSEFNGSDSERVHLLQMWLLPAERGTEPRYAQRAFPEESRKGKLCLIAAPEAGDDALTIGQDARVHASILGPGERLEFETEPHRRLWLHVARGSLTLNGETLEDGDGAGVRNEILLNIEGVRDAEFVLFDLAEDGDHE